MVKRNKFNSFRTYGRDVSVGQCVRPSPAFTLIELLVVIAIISLLVSILLPSMTKAKDLARLTTCAANEHAIGVAVHMYVHENEGWLVTANSLDGFYTPWNYLLSGGGYADSVVFRCPSHQPMDGTDPATLRSYALNAWITYNAGSVSAHMKYDQAESYHGGASMCLLYDLWRGWGDNNGEYRENTLDEKAGNLCWQLWPMNDSQSEHMPDHLINFLFLDGHVSAYEAIFFRTGSWPQQVYDWYFLTWKI